MADLSYDVKKMHEEASGYFSRFDHLTGKDNMRIALAFIHGRADKILTAHDLSRSPATKARLDFIMQGCRRRLRLISEITQPQE